MSFVIRQVAASDTHDLRRRVLRNGDATARLDWPGDDATSTVHLGAFTQHSATSTRDARLVGVSTWLLESDPLAPEFTAVQLRGMATEPDMTGHGVGSMLLAAGREHARSVGAERVWANARLTALGFYERAGFVAQGEEFVTSTTGVAHRHVHLLVPA